jgi:hypothetical protein
MPAAQFAALVVRDANEIPPLLWQSRLISLPEQLRLDLPQVVGLGVRDGYVNPAEHLGSFLLWPNKRSS